MTDTVNKTAKGRSALKKMVNYKWIIRHLPFFGPSRNIIYSKWPLGR